MNEQNNYKKVENKNDIEDYYLKKEEELRVQKEKQLKKLEKEGKSVILDDRMWKKFWFGQKASDCELWWIPNRIVISPKTIENWGYELKNRVEEKFVNF